MLAINETLFAVILVGRVMSGKTSLSTTNKKSLVALWEWWLIRFKFQLAIKIQGYFSLEIFPSNKSKSDRNSCNFELGTR